MSHSTAFIDAIDTIPSEQWDALFPASEPFTQHAFLHSLASSGATTARSGWQPHHFCVWQGEQLVAAVPLYQKTHSYGEYLFDWAFAEAHQRYQQPYYPKWLGAIPFTPATGQRFGIHPQAPQWLTVEWLLQTLADKAQQAGIQHLQILYPLAIEAAQAPEPWLTRYDLQFHWYNRGYQDFEQFLAALKSRKCKIVRKERQQVAELPLSIKEYSGDQLTAAQIRRCFAFYRDTYAKRSGHLGYLTEQTFEQWFTRLGQSIVVVAASDANGWVAAAIFFRSETTLYGRYWGCLEDYDKLHFELCYYRGIDYCIRHQLQRFDAGAQGEHKRLRGFEVTRCYGLYHVEASALAAAISDYCQAERQQIDALAQEFIAQSPYLAEP